MTIANWLTLLGSLAAGLLGAGIALGRLEALKARVAVLERGAVDKGRRLEAVREQLAIINYKLFGRRPTSSADSTDSGEDKS